MIRKATYSDINLILSLTKACTKSMEADGIIQWNEHYPNAKAFEKDIDREELFVLLDSEEIIGTVVVSSLMDLEYEAIDWLTSSGNNTYIHRLAVHPKHHRKGYAQKLMDFAEELAKAQRSTSVRLDTFSKNLRNQKFYELRGYKKLGEIYFPNQSEFPFYCYELLL